MLIVLFVVNVQSLLGQQNIKDSVKVLTGVEILGARNNDGLSGMKGLNIDSMSLKVSHTSNLNELLEKNTSLYTRTYGQGGMSTLSFRGSTASQSGVFWNGFNIKGRSTSMTDLSLVPVLFFSNIRVAYGGSSNIYGSGVIGGSIHLDEPVVYRKGVHAEAGFAVGSFGAFEPGVKFRISGSNWVSSTAMIYKKAENDYPYVFAGTESTQENANIETRALYQQFDMKFSASNQLNLALWLQDDDKSLPPPASGSASQEYRRDKSLRLSSRWKSLLGPASGYNAGLAYLHDDMHYTNVSKSDQQVLVDSRIVNDVIIADFSGYRHFQNNWELSLRINGEYARADVNSFGGVNAQATASLAGGLKKKWLSGKWVAAIDLRQEWAEGYSVPFCPYLGLEVNALKNIKLYANASKNFRIPSLNDRYWVPGGNEDLLPETSINMETGMLYHLFKNSSLRVAPGFSVFYSDIENMIVWIPSGSLWSAENVQNVVNKGVELGIDAEYSIQRSRLFLKMDYTYVSSTSQNKTSPNDASVGKQQIYTPENRVVTKLSYRIRGVYAFINHSYTGVVYCNRDNTEQLPANSLLDLGFRYSFSMGKNVRFESGITVNNILDHQYQFINYYPAPGRNFKLDFYCRI